MSTETETRHPVFEGTDYCGAPVEPNSVCIKELGHDDDHGRRAPFEAVHGWFGLTYANYLVLPRTLLQSMPDEWQGRFVACLEELDAAFAHLDHADYAVQARDPLTGRYIADPIPHYNRGREHVEPRL